MQFLLTRTMAVLSGIRPSEDIRPNLRPGRWLGLAVLGLVATGLPAYAVNRDVSITAPDTAVEGSDVSISVEASTDAKDGEAIGFFHADFSTDNGVTWKAISYATNEGTTTAHSTSFRVGRAGSKAVVRVRVAFRGGKAGDVDFAGQKIDWAASWNKWQKPPAKEFTIRIVAR